MDYYSPLGPQAVQGLVLGPESANFDKEKNDVWSVGKVV